MRLGSSIEAICASALLDLILLYCSCFGESASPQQQQHQRANHVPPLREQIRQHQQQQPKPSSRPEVRQRGGRQTTTGRTYQGKRATPPSAGVGGAPDGDRLRTIPRYEIRDEDVEMIYDDGFAPAAITIVDEDTHRQQPQSRPSPQPKPSPKTFSAASASVNRPIAHVSPIDNNCTNDTTIIKKLLTDYNKHKLPDPYGVTVKVEFWIQEISSVSEISNDFEMDIYINEMWLDKALAFDDMNPCKHNISLSHQVFDKLWTPNSCFINSKQASIHDSPFRNIFLMIYPNGTVWANYRVKVKGPCDMDLSKFPMDIQKCSLVYESFSYNRAEVRMQWGDREDPVYPLKNFTLPDFVLIHMLNSSGTVVYPAGQWDELYATFTFQRRYMWYILQAYIPTYLTIFISWISFTLGSKAIPARTMLGVNSLLAMIMMFGNIMKNLPRVSYVKAIDVWMLACMTFNFCSLLELAIVGYMTKDPSPCKGGSISSSMMMGGGMGGMGGGGLAHGAAGSMVGAANVAVGMNAMLGTSSSSTYMTGKKLCRHYQPNQCQPGGSIDHRGSSMAHERAMNRYIFDETKSTGRLKNLRNMLCPPIWTAEKIDKASCFAFPVAFSLFNIFYWFWYLRT